MDQREKPKQWLLLSTVGLSLYGLYCMVAQTAYCLAMPYDDYLYTRMEGPHAIAFGASLLLLAVSGVAGRLWNKDGNDRAAWLIRGLGIAIVIPLVWYALSGGTHFG